TWAPAVAKANSVAKANRSRGQARVLRVLVIEPSSWCLPDRGRHGVVSAVTGVVAAGLEVTDVRMVRAASIGASAANGQRASGTASSRVAACSHEASPLRTVAAARRSTAGKPVGRRRVTLDGVAAVAALLRRGDAVVLSGAGISTESGIPVYRGPAAAGRERRPITYQEFVRSERARQRYWARSFAGWPFMAARRPNAGHRAVAALE